MLGSVPPVTGWGGRGGGGGEGERGPRGGGMEGALTGL